MADNQLLSPDTEDHSITNTKSRKTRTPIVPPPTPALQSPTSPFFLGSNDDQLERAEARAARAAVSIRRQAMASATAASVAPPDRVLTKDQIIDLFQNCIKLATENKITQKNTWELKLIDHLSELIKVETEDDAELDFQKASCTLEAGVKIYSFRVDSAYSEAYKVLGGIIRSGGEDHQEESAGRVDNDESGEGKNPAKKETERKISPMSTIEQSFETFNAEKFDVAFAVDPLYYQTSAQFDEGGAKGLLLNNLGVYGDCRVLFDSIEVPGKCISGTDQHINSHIDLSFCRDCVEQMVINMPRKNHISPSLGAIISQSYVDNRCPSHEFTEDLKSAAKADAVDDGNVQADGNWSVDLETATYSYDKKTRFVDDSLSFEETTALRQHQKSDSCKFYKPDLDGSLQEFAAFILQGLGFPSKQRAWAGPDHWKFSKHKDSEDAPAKESKSGFSTESSRHSKSYEPDPNFSNCLGRDLSHIFAPPRVPRTLLLPVKRQPFKAKLPEDCHYQPEDLVKLFLLPSIQIPGIRRSQQPDGNTSWKSNSFGREVSNSYEWGFGGQSTDECACSDLEDYVRLPSQACQVTKIDVQYDRTSKEVDVQVLKETLWDHIQEVVQMPEAVIKDQISFKHVLATFPRDCLSAVPGDISPHLCFICLLHLANEHSLCLNGCPNMDDLSVCFPSSRVNVSN